VATEQTKQIIGQRIRDRRESFFLTREALCERLKAGGYDISGTHLYNIESGLNSISAENLSILANALKTPLAYFYGESYLPDMRPEEYTALALMDKLTPAEINGWLLPLIKVVVELSAIKSKKAN